MVEKLLHKQTPSRANLQKAIKVERLARGRPHFHDEGGSAWFH